MISIHRKFDLHLLWYAFLIDSRQKQYKDKFKAWKWIKRLPGDIAQWMVGEANSREVHYGKDTIFSYKGQILTREQAENSVSWTRKMIGKLGS